MPVIGILDHSQGIQSVMDMPSADRLPQARDTGATPLKEAGLEELYAPNNARLVGCRYGVAQSQKRKRRLSSSSSRLSW